MTCGTRVKLRIRKLAFTAINERLRKGKKWPPVWWIEGLPYEECQLVRCGPYKSYEEARSDKEGMQRVFDDPDFT